MNVYIYLRRISQAIICSWLLTTLLALEVRGQSTCVPAPSGLVGWWPAEGNSFDIAGGNNATQTNGTTFVPGFDGLAFNFDGSTSMISVPASPSLNVSNLTIEAWIFPTDSTTPRPIFEFANATGYSSVNFWYNIGAGVQTIPGALFGFARDAVNNFYVVSQGGSAPTYQWSHVAYTFDSMGQMGKLYVNGTNVASVNFNAPIHPNTSLGVNIGYRPVNSAELYAGFRFAGKLDEVSLYNRPLTAGEINAIYQAGAAGKCSSIPPVIVSQPASQVASVGNGVTLSVLAAGNPSLSYQWQKNSVNLDGATNGSLTFTNVQLTDAGTYSVTVSNVLGVVTSAPATLTVNPAPQCQQPPPGLVGWWSGDGTAVDLIGGNNGTLRNGAGFGAGEVGQAFAFVHSTNELVEIPDSPALNPAVAMTLEAWAYVTAFPNTDLSIIACKQSPSVPEYQLLIDSASGRLTFRPLVTTSSGLFAFDGSTSVQLDTWYHVAMTYDGSALRLYVNGALDGSVAATGAITTASSPLRIGGFGTGPWDLAGRVDELSLYDRALSMAEIQSIVAAGSAGKCHVPVPPSFVIQPQNQISTFGSNATFTVAAGGSEPLSYQWLFNGAPLSGDTNSSLTLSNVSQADVGAYSVFVTNIAGSATSKTASLTAAYPPASLQVSGATVANDGTVTASINLVANGNENAASFSLNFDSTLLQYASITLGSNATGGSLLLNSSLASTGQVGIALALPAGTTFSAGTQQMVVATFNSPIVTASTSTFIGFGDTPIKRQVADASGATLAASYMPGSILLPVSELEGDVYPRPDGDAALTISDWVLVGRYVAGLDSPTNSSEFQRADCAPRSTLGDGALTVSDWVQAGRYAAGLDPLTRIGGPTSPVPMAVTGPLVTAGGRKTQSNLRQVRATAPGLSTGQVGAVEISLKAQGNENALAFSLSFDPSKVVFCGVAKGNGANGATLNVNTNQAAQGQLGFVLGLNANQTFGAANQQLVRVYFRPAAAATGNAAISFSDQPVARGVCDATAELVAADYIDSNIVVSGRPSLKIVISNKSVTLSWPASASGFVLQQSGDSTLSPGSWTSVTATATTSNNESVVSLPASANCKFYRLYHP